MAKTAVREYKPRGPHRPQPAPAPTGGLPLADLVEDYLSSCKARGLAPSTVNNVYGFSLREVFLRWCAEKEITTLAQLDQRAFDAMTSDMLARKTRWGEPLSKATVHTYVRTARQFLAWCEKDGEEVLAKPQLPKLGRKVIDVLSRDEIDKLEDHCQNERDRLIVRLMADTGIRVGELLALRPEDLIRAQDRRAFLKIQGKGSKERLVPIGPVLVRRLDRYLRTRPDEVSGDRIFVANRKSPYGDYPPLTKSGVLRITYQASERAKLKRRVHPHLLRHSFATEALRQGMGPVQLAQVLGHSGLRMIEQVYSHLTATDAYDAVLKVFAPR
ncbi:MAG: tyrosine-type recombinase/integrase [Candidatus Dormibacteria bacterium]